MATPDATIRLGQVGLEQDIQRAIQKVNARGGLNVKLNARSFTQPLGKITASADEFTKSIEASNARVIAFGASVGIINSISAAFKNLITETVALEKRLTEVNVVLGASGTQLASFGKQLFDVARNTAQSFDTVSEAALEFSRQGLSMEETLKRTQDALILTRLTGLKAADSVKGLTATINSFATAGLNTAEIISKLAAVDVEFAVSSEDLINALSRAGAVAQDAGLDFDQLVAAVTSAQQITARGGAVIGNSFKTIFTRIQRADTLDRLQELGIAVRDVRGETLPAMMILQQLAKTYDSLTDSTKSAVAEQVGGVFQINVLKAALKDLSSENSIYQRAVVTSASATDEAIRKNDQLNQTLDALSKQTLVSVKELSAAVGDIAVGPGVEKVLNMVNDLAQGATRLLDGEGIGSTLANGILKGIGTIISGPGLVVIGGLIGKLFIDVTAFAAKSFKNIIGLNNKAREQKALQDSIFNTLQSNERINRVLEQLEGNKAAQAKFLFNEVSRTTAEYTKQVGLSRQLASTLGQMGVVGGAGGLALGGRRGRSQVASARGFIPNYAVDPTTQEMMDIKLGVGGVTESAKPVTLKGFNAGNGQVVDMVANTQEFFVKNFDGKGGDAIFNPEMIRQFGMPEGAKKITGARGYIPNYATATAQTLKEHLGGPSVKLTPETLGNLSENKLQEIQKKISKGQISTQGHTFLKDSQKEFLKLTKGGKSFGSYLFPAVTPKSKKGSKTGKAIDFSFGPGVGDEYGIVLPQTGPNQDQKLSVPQSKIVKGAPFPRGSTISVEGVNVARLKKDNKYEAALKEEMTKAVRGLARSLLPSAKDSAFNREDFRKFLDKSAKPQFLGRLFELALQYVSGTVVENVPGGERFDFKKGLPKRVDEVFGLTAGAAKKKWDAKNSLASDSQASMIEKILLEEAGMPSKKGLGKRLEQGIPGATKRPISAAEGFIPNFAGKSTFQNLLQRKSSASPLRNKGHGLLSSKSSTVGTVLGRSPGLGAPVRISDVALLQDSIMRETGAGVPGLAVRVDSSAKLKGPSNPSGLAVTNIIDEPGGLQDVFREKRAGLASRGFIPNFARVESLDSKKLSTTGSVVNLKPIENEIKKQEAALKAAGAAIEKYENAYIQKGKQIEKNLNLVEKSEQGLQSINNSIDKEKNAREQSRGKRAALQQEAQKIDQQIAIEKRKTLQSSAAGQANDKKLLELQKQRRALSSSIGAQTKKINSTTREIDKQNRLRLSTERDIARTQQSIKALTNRQEKTQRLINRKKQDEATAATNVRAAESRRGNIKESRGNLAQGAGIAAMIGGPMLIGAIEQAIFRGMSRLEMSQGQRALQGGLQGGATGISTAGMLAMFMPGGLLAKSVVGFTTVAISAFAGMQQAAELTFDELQQKFQESNMVAQGQLDAAQKIVDARRAIRESLGDAGIVQKASKVIRDEFHKIKDVNLKTALSDTSMSLNGLQAAVDTFSKSLQGRKEVQEILSGLSKIKDGMGRQFRSDIGISTLKQGEEATSQFSDLFDKLQVAVSRAEIDPAVAEKLKGRVSNINKAMAKLTEGGIRSTDGVQAQNVRKAMAFAIKDFVSVIAQGVFDPTEGEALSKQALRTFSKGLSTNVGANSNEQKAQNELFQVLVDRFNGLLETNADSVIDTILELEVKVASNLKNIRDQIDENVRNGLSKAQAEITKTKFDITITDKLDSFRQSAMSKILPIEELEKQISSAQVQKFTKEFSVTNNELISKNITSFTDNLNKIFGGTDAGATLVNQLTTDFQNDPRGTIAQVQQLIEAGDGVLGKLGKTYDEIINKQLDPIKNALEKVKAKQGEADTVKDLDAEVRKFLEKVIPNLSDDASLNDIAKKLNIEVSKLEAQTFDNLKTIVDQSGSVKNDTLAALSQLQTAFQQADSALVERAAIAQIERKTAEIQLTNAREVNKIQNEFLAQSNQAARQLRTIGIDLKQELTEIDLDMSDPLKVLGGFEKISRDAAAERLKIERQIEAQKQKNTIEQTQALNKVFQNQALLESLGLQTSATTLNTQSNYTLAEAITNLGRSFTEKNISGLEGSVNDNKKDVEAADEILKKEQQKLAVLKQGRQILDKNRKIGIVSEGQVFQSLNDEAAGNIAEQRGQSPFKNQGELALFRSQGIQTGAQLDTEINNQEAAVANATKNRNEAKAKATSAENALKKANEFLSILEKIRAKTEAAMTKLDKLEFGEKEARSNAAKLQGIMIDIIKNADSSTSDADLLEQFRKQIEDVNSGLKLSGNAATAAENNFQEVINTVRDGKLSLKEFGNELKNVATTEAQRASGLSFEAGAAQFSADLAQDIDGFGAKLGRDVPSAFRDGMTNALSAVVNQTDNLRDALLGIANSFLQTVQQAFLQQASNQFVQTLGFKSAPAGFASGGYVGNGGRVPAMLTNGEYVMSREAVSRLGSQGMEKLNKGTLSIPGFATGGGVGNKARTALSQHMNTFGTAFDDSKSARFFSEFYQSVPKATREVSLQAAADQEAQAEIQAKKAKKKQLMSTIISLAASAALAFGAKKIGQFVDNKRAASGKLVKASWGADIAWDGAGFVGKGSLTGPQQERLSGLNNYMRENGALVRNQKGIESLVGQARKANLLNQGGPVQAYAGGGQVRGPAGRDVIPAVLTEGEYVIKASSARKYGKRFLDNLNYGSQGYYNGGATGPMPVGGSQNFNLNMNFDVASGQTESQQGQGQSNGQKGQDQNINQFAQNIRKLVQEEIQKEQRAGGLLRGTRR